MTDDQAVSELVRMLHGLRRREARRRAGPELTYRELAGKTGWSLGSIAQYFSGKSLPPVDRLDVIGRLLGASPAEQGTLATARDLADDARRHLMPPGDRATIRRAEIRLLGPVEVIGPGGPAALTGARQRTLIALLALDAGRVVTQACLVDALWGETPPRTAVTTLYSHIARLRQRLDSCGLPGLLLTHGSGYVLRVRPDEVDTGRFTNRVTQARQAVASGRITDAAARLREALALWRGDALADASPVGWLAAEVDRLHETRLAAQEDLWDARLRLGEHAVAVDELEKQLVTHPARERLVELFMLALYRCGRHTEAIGAYQRLRAQLVEELGVEPGPHVANTYTAVLRRSPDLDLAPEVDRPPATLGVPRPAQLPSRVGHFVGRDRALASLSGLLGGPSRMGRVGVVCGPAGMGKTALAVEWAHRIAPRYPDGQLFLDLRGHDPAAATPVTEALTQLLRGLDIPPTQIPTDPEALIGRYRSVLNGRRVLVVLDNAASAEQVASLVPPSATSLLLVTSRNQLAGLAVDYAVTSVDLDVLSAEESLTLLRKVLGAARVDGEPDAAGELIELCGRMPLALRIAAAKLAILPQSAIAGLIGDLTGPGRLAILAVPGESRSIRAVFASAYQALSPPAARVFRLMGSHPGPSFTQELAATVAALSASQARDALDELVSAHLLIGMGIGRYRFHDLIRLYAKERLGSDEDAKATARTIDWYLVVADAANRVLDPARDRVGPPSVCPPVMTPFSAHRDHALTFLDGERANLVPVVRHAAERGHDRAAWQLTYLLTSFQLVRGHPTDQAELCRVGLAAAQRCEDPAAEALMRSLLGVACNRIQRYEEALDHLREALRLTRSDGDNRGQAMALNNIALANGRLGRLDAAIDAFHQALELHATDNHRPGVALALNNIGHAYTLMGKSDLALDPLHQALALAREIDHPHLEASALQSLGEVYFAEARYGNALDHLTKALPIRQSIGDQRNEADTLIRIGLTHRACGDHTAAAAHLRQALAISQDLGDRHLEAATLMHLRGDQNQTNER